MFLYTFKTFCHSTLIWNERSKEHVSIYCHHCLPTWIPWLKFQSSFVDYLPLEKRSCFFFVEYEEAAGKTGKILAFATENDIRRLSAATELLFYSGGSGQFFTINTIFGVQDSEVMYPNIYALCSHRTELMYRCLFSNILQVMQDRFGIHLPQIQWRRMLMDFEIAVRSVNAQISQQYFAGLSSSV